MHKCCTLIFPLVGGMTLLMLLAFNFLNKFQCTREDGRDVQYGEMGSVRAPLLPHKDDDLMILCQMRIILKTYLHWVPLKGCH
jgi:hypothetical protein